MSAKPDPTCRVCELPLAKGHFLCEVHWDQLPADAKSKVNKAATVVRRAGTSASKDDLARLWRAQDEALAELTLRATEDDVAHEDLDLAPNYEVTCMNCEASPTVGDEGLCGPCFFGDASTAGGEW